MNAQTNILNKVQANQPEKQADEIDLMALFGALLDKKGFILSITAAFLFIGCLLYTSDAADE